MTSDEVMMFSSLLLKADNGNKINKLNKICE